MRKIPKGKCTPTRKADENIICWLHRDRVAPFVSFVAPLRKIGKKAARWQPSLYLLNGQPPLEFGYKEETDPLRRRMPWFKYLPTLSRRGIMQIGRAKSGARTMCYASMPTLGTDATNTTRVPVRTSRLIANSKAIL